MELFTSREKLAKLQKRSRVFTWIFRGLAAGMLTLFVILCLVIRTVNAGPVTRAMVASMTLLGWAGIALYTLGVRPARAKAAHEAMLTSAEAETCEGILRLSGGVIQVPKSIRVLRITLEGEESPNPAEEPERKRLNLDESLTDRMPPEGSRVRVQAVNDYITGLEVLEEGTGESGKTRRSGSFRRTWGKISALFIPFILWTMAVVIIGGFIFSRITDTDPQHKIVIYADCEIRGSAELADLLEQQLDDPIRMVKIRPFTYDMMFGSSEIQNGDLYIVSAAKAEGLRGWFVPLPENMRDMDNLLVMEGIPYGIPVYSRETRDYTAAAYFDYDPRETYYLVFSAASTHLAGNDGATDNRAAEAADALLEIP